MLNSSTLAVPHQHPGSGKIARQLQRKNIPEKPVHHLKQYKTKVQQILNHLLPIKHNNKKKQITFHLYGVFVKFDFLRTWVDNNQNKPGSDIICEGTEDLR